MSLQQIKLFGGFWTNLISTKVQKFVSQFKNLDDHPKSEIALTISQTHWTASVPSHDCPSHAQIAVDAKGPFPFPGNSLSHSNRS